VRTALNLVDLFARVSAPVIPFAAEAIAQAVGESWPPAWPSANAAIELSRLEAGRPVRAPEVLFKKIDDALLLEWTERFGGPEQAPAAARP
jgi:methionyl-tRNA synthetase